MNNNSAEDQSAPALWYRCTTEQGGDLHKTRLETVYRRLQSGRASSLRLCCGLSWTANLPSTGSCEGRHTSLRPWSRDLVHSVGSKCEAGVERRAPVINTRTGHQQSKSR